jgi:hypothetical protein
MQDVQSDSILAGCFSLQTKPIPVTHMTESVLSPIV